MPPRHARIPPDMAERGGRRRGDRCHCPLRRPISGIRLVSEGVLIGAQTMSAEAAACSGRGCFQDRSSECLRCSGGVNRAADLYAGLFAASVNLAPVDTKSAASPTLH